MKDDQILDLYYKLKIRFNNKNYLSDRNFYFLTKYIFMVINLLIKFIVRKTKVLNFNKI